MDAFLARRMGMRVLARVMEPNLSSPTRNLSSRRLHRRHHLSSPVLGALSAVGKQGNALGVQHPPMWLRRISMYLVSSLRCLLFRNRRRHHLRPRQAGFFGLPHRVVRVDPPHRQERECLEAIELQPLTNRFRPRPTPLPPLNSSSARAWDSFSSVGI